MHTSPFIFLLDQGIFPCAAETLYTWSVPLAALLMSGNLGLLPNLDMQSWNAWQLTRRLCSSVLSLSKGHKDIFSAPKGALRLHSSTALRHSPASLLVARYRPKNSTTEILASFSPWSWYFLRLSFLFLGFSTEDSHSGSNRLNPSTFMRSPAPAIMYTDRNATVNACTGKLKESFLFQKFICKS